MGANSEKDNKHIEKKQMEEYTRKQFSSVMLNSFYLFVIWVIWRIFHIYFIKYYMFPDSFYITKNKEIIVF